MNTLIIIWAILIFGAIVMLPFITREKNLYEVIYREGFREYTTVIEAKDRCQAVKKIRRMSTYYVPPEIISVRRV